MLGSVSPCSQCSLGDRVLRQHGSLLHVGHHDFTGLGDLRLAPDDLNLVLFQQTIHTHVEPTRHAPRPRHNFRRIESDILRRQAVIFGMLHVVINLSRTQQRLGGDTAPIEADTTDVFALDDGGFETELRGADGRDVATRASANNQNVEVSVGHFSSPCAPFEARKSSHLRVRLYN